MEIQKLKSNKGKFLNGPLILTPKVFKDSRGYFYESWNQNILEKKLKEKIEFQQDNHTCSKIGVIRGLHYQIPPFPQGKLVRCPNGEIFDVAVDIRKNSDTFGEWVSATLNNINKSIFWIPVGFAHGFLSLKDQTEVLYKASGPYSKDYERSIRWDDSDINIKWPFQIINLKDPILSEKDKNANSLSQADIFN